MGWLKSWLAKRNRSPSEGRDSSSPQSQDAMRRHLLAIALRDTLRAHGIPSAWITLEARPTASRTRDRGMHMRLVVREWEGRLPGYFVALEKEIGAALRRLAPLSAEWLTGMSWRFALLDDRYCPALPPPETWLCAPVLLTSNGTPARVSLLRPDEDFAGARGDFVPTQPRADAPVGLHG